MMDRCAAVVIFTDLVLTTSLPLPLLLLLVVLLIEDRLLVEVVDSVLSNALNRNIVVKARAHVDTP